MSDGITVSYSGVHQAYQLALAAHELRELDCFYCSLFDAPGKWGGVLCKILGSTALVNRRVNGLPSEKIKEYPWPLAWHILRKHLRLKSGNDWLKTNDQFDLCVAKKLSRSRSRIFIGSETCARNSFKAAQERGMKKILDCPQAHPKFLTDLLARASDNLNLPPPSPFDSPELTARKLDEFAMADKLLVISEVQRRSFHEAGFSNDQLIQIPLWVDSELWFPARAPKKSVGPLKALFVGSIGLRKGIPYLVHAIDKCQRLAELTFAGTNSGEVNKFISEARAPIHFAGQKNKTQLREMYWNCDLLVLPSLIDTFGFVALEAMACGLPVIVTDNCGVPVPDPSWRVPIMNSDAIAQRLEFYAKDRDALQYDGQIAATFAKQYTPERYREQIKNLLRKLLHENN